MNTLDGGPPGRRRLSAELVRQLGVRGDVPIRCWPVLDHERLSRLIALITRIDGLEHVTVQGFDGHDALLLAHVAGPVSVSLDLADRLDRGLVACVRDGDRVDIQIAARSTGGPAPSATARPTLGEVPPGLRAHHIDARSRVRTAEPDPFPHAGPSAATDPPAPQPDAAAPGVSAAELVERALRSVLDLSLMVCDRDLRVLTISGPAWPPRPDGPPAGRGVRDVLPQETWRALAPGLLTALGGGSETVRFAGEAAGVRFEATCTPVIDDGAVIGATAVARDDGDRGQEAALALMRGEFDEVFEHSPVGQGLLSIDGRWVRVNARLCEVLGVGPADLIGSAAGLQVHPDDRAREGAWFRELLAGRESGASTTVRVLARPGRPAAVRAHVSVLRSPAGWPRGAIVQVSHDES